MISRMSSTPVREAASISSTSTWRPSAMARQGSQTPQGSIVGPPAPVGADAVQPLGDDPRGGGLADAAHAGQHEGMGDAVGREGVAQGAHHRLLPDQVGEGLRPVFPGEDLIGGACRTWAPRAGSAESRRGAGQGQRGPGRARRFRKLWRLLRSSAPGYSSRFLRLSCTAPLTVLPKVRLAGAGLGHGFLVAGDPRAPASASGPGAPGQASPASSAARTAQPGSPSCAQSVKRQGAPDRRCRRRWPRCLRRRRSGAVRACRACRSASRRASGADQIAGRRGVAAARISFADRRPVSCVGAGQRGGQRGLADAGRSDAGPSVWPAPHHCASAGDARRVARRRAPARARRARPARRPRRYRGRDRSCRPWSAR